MNKKKFNVVLDTNFLWRDREEKLDQIFNTSFEDLLSFLDENDLKSNVEVKVPTVVLEERVAQRFDVVQAVIAKHEDAVEKLKPFTTKEDKIELSERDVEKALREEGTKFLKANDIALLPLPTIPTKDLVERSLRHIPPFANKGDKGFKDTLIWLTILADVKENKESHYIFCTNNTEDFKVDELSQEFAVFSKNSLTILSTLPELKEYLDKELVLNLELKRKHSLVEDEIKRKIGEIMLQVNTLLVTSPGRDNFWAHASRTQMSFFGETADDQLVKGGYDFLGLNILDIREDSPGIFNVDVGLKVIQRKTQEREKGLIYNRVTAYESGFMRSMRGADEEKKLKISLQYIQTEGKIVVNNVYVNRYYPFDDADFIPTMP